MSSNQELFNAAYDAVIAQLDGTSPTDVLELDAAYEQMFEACNPIAYHPANPPAVPTVAQYAHLFGVGFGFIAITDTEGETFYFEENPVVDALRDRFAYLIPSPEATRIHRSYDANQAVSTEMLNLLRHTAGNASDELAFYAIGVMEDALSSRNPYPAVLSDDYRAVLRDVLLEYREDGAAEAVCDRLETMLSERNPTRLIVDAKGVARPDAGKWS